MDKEKFRIKTYGFGELAQLSSNKKVVSPKSPIELFYFLKYSISNGNFFKLDSTTTQII